jgi:peptidoglycan/xylan/chitin deacetylase (PgdA/CDA1 family)
MTAPEPLSTRRDVPVCRHSWIWFVLGPSHRRVDVQGDPSLADYLRESGFDVTITEDGLDEAASEADAVVTVVGIRPDPVRLRERLLPARPDQLVAVAIAGGATTAPLPTNSIVRAFELAGSVRDATIALLLARRLRRDLHALSFTVQARPTGDRSRKHGLGRGGWTARRRLPIGWIVVASRAPARSAVDVVLAETAAALGDQLRVLRADAFESGKILLRARDRRGRPFYIRVAGGRVAPYLDQSREQLGAVVARRPPAELRAKIVEPLAHGVVGPVNYVAEQKAPGRHPRSVTGARWRAALDFLGALRGLDQVDSRSAGAFLDDVDEQVQRVSAHARADQAATLARIRSRLESTLPALPLGFRHGDFWPENLLYRGSTLASVLDWEWASFDSVPLFDAFDILSTALWRDRRRPFGTRVSEVLIPLAEAGGDSRLDDFIARRGPEAVRRDPTALVTLVSAYWLDRVSRDLATASERELPGHWLEMNVREPLDEIRQAFDRHPEHAAGAALPTARTSRRRSEDVVVLCYHGISPTWKSDLSVPPDSLAQQVEALLGKGYRGATFQDAIFSREFPKTFAITFDDAYISVFEHALPILSRAGVPATVFVPTSFPDSKNPMSWPGIEKWVDTPDAAELTCMTWEQLRELRRQGWEVGSHTCTHPHLTTLDDSALADELRLSRLMCEERLEAPCLSIAYPYGDVDARVAAAAQAAGYRLGATLPAGFHVPTPLRWPRVGMYGGDSELEFRLKTSRRVRSLRTRYDRVLRRSSRR